MNGTPPCRVDEQSARHTSTPKGRFVLRADAIRPYNPCGSLLPFNGRLNPISFAPWGVYKTVWRAVRYRAG